MMIDSAQEAVAAGAAAVGAVVADAGVLAPVVDVALRMKPPF